MLAQAGGGGGGGKEEEGEAAALLDIAAALAGKGAPLHLRQVQSVSVPESLERVFFQLEHPSGTRRAGPRWISAMMSGRGR